MSPPFPCRSFLLFVALTLSAPRVAMGGGTALASFVWGDHGAPAILGGFATRGLRPTANSASATGHWGAALSSGRIPSPSLVGVAPRLTNPSFQLRTSQSRRGLVLVESFDSANVSTGRAQTFIEASTNLNDWTLIATDPGRVGQALTITDTPPANSSARFLRLRATARAGQTFTRAFPTAPPTLPVLSGLNNQPTRATIYFPRDYRADRTYPLAVLINSARGGDGADTGFGRSIVGDHGWFVLAVPSWKASVEPLDSTGSNEWDRIRIRNSDAATIWNGLRPVLEWAATLAPNIDRSRSVIGGFSNGAHTAAALFSNAQTAPAVSPWFGRIALVDGGNSIAPAISLSGKQVLLLQGQLHHYDIFGTIRAGLVASGAAITDALMLGVGHEFPAAARTTIRDWLSLPPVTP